MASPNPKPSPSYYTDYTAAGARSSSSNAASRNKPSIGPVRDNYPTTDEQFRNVQTERLTDPTRAEQKRAEYEAFLEAAAANEQVAQNRQAAVLAQNNRRFTTPSTTVSAAPGSLSGSLSRARDLRVNWWLGAWAVWFWLTFQLPFAMLSLVFLGMQAVVEGTWIGQALAAAAGVVESAVSLFGGSLALATPISIATGLHFLVFGLSLFFLLITMFVYALSGQSPLWGTRSTAKVGAFLLCLIGYSVPGFNLFPWVLGYILVMSRADG